MKRKLFAFISIFVISFTIVACATDLSSTTTTIESTRESSLSTTTTVSFQSTSETISNNITVVSTTSETSIAPTTQSITTEETTQSTSTIQPTTAQSTTTQPTTTQSTTTQATTTQSTTTQATTTQATTTQGTTTQETTTQETTTQETTTQSTTTQATTTKATTTQETTTQETTTQSTTTQSTTTQSTTTQPTTTQTTTQITTEPLPEVTLVSEGFLIDEMNSIDYYIELNDLTFDSIFYNQYELILNQDYQFNELTNTLTLSAEFIIHIYSASTDIYTLVLNTTEDRNVNFDIVFNHSVNRIINACFETGDLYGWIPFKLWKDETIMSAFQNERVVSTGYYGVLGTDLYNRDGNYHFGLYIDPYDNANKDLNQERMGMLQSSTFILDGSGYISFKLGGGKNTATTYVSIHDAETHQEIARYGNSNFSDTSISQTNNAEGYMFQYYADLSSYLDKELYILIVDGASHEWSVLSFDSFITYHERTPTYESYEVAINIIPSITNAGSGFDYIQNGELSSTFDGWENPNGAFQISNGGAISSIGGNETLGVLRSSAFIVTDNNNYLQFDFAGAIASDKQVFILVKEVGTNMEVLRLTRRDDLSGRSDSGNFEHHWYDLSSLSTEKEYYIEIVDNKDGDWGVALVKNFALVSSNYGNPNEEAVNAFYGVS
jgi:hypothetical protein